MAKLNKIIHSILIILTISFFLCINSFAENHLSLRVPIEEKAERIINCEIGEELEGIILDIKRYYQINITTFFINKPIEIISKHIFESPLFGMSGWLPYIDLDPENFLYRSKKLIGVLESLIQIVSAFSDEKAMCSYAKLLCDTNDEQRRELGNEIIKNTDFRKQLTFAMEDYSRYLKSQEEKICEIITRLEERVKNARLYLNAIELNKNI